MSKTNLQIQKPAPANQSKSNANNVNSFSLQNEILPVENIQLSKQTIIQPKLEIGKPSDRYEQEADSFADRIMMMPDVSAKEKNQTKPIAENISPLLQSSFSKTSEELISSLKLESKLNNSKNNGNSLPENTRSFMESRFGADFSNVKIHTDSNAVQMNRELNANAFTYGSDIYFNRGKFNPENSSGKHLLAHELTHVVQQRGEIRKNIVQSQKETWYRGEGTGVAPSSPGGAIHDFGDGLYLTDDPAIAAIYASTRAGAQPGSTALLLSASVERSLFGRVLDLTTDSRWKQFLSERIGPYTNEALIKLANENYWEIFQAFLKKNNLQLENYDSIIGPEFVRGGNQICIRNPVIAASIRSVLKSYIPPVGETSEKPSSPPNSEAPAEELGSGEPATNTPSIVKVQSTVNVTNSVVKPDGSVVSEVEVRFSQGVEAVKSAVPSGGKVPISFKFQITQNADGSFASAEPLTGEPPSLVEALGRQIVSEAANATEGAVATGVSIASKALPYVRTGLKWGGPALFVIVTGYQLITATPSQRPRVLAKATGGFLGGLGTGYLICNGLLDLETAGWGILICGVLAGGVGGYVGSEAAGGIYDSANSPPGLTELEQALLSMDHQPNNVKSLFNTMVSKSGSNGIAITPEFVYQFIYTVPSDLAIDELYLLAGQLQDISSTANLQSIIDNLSRRIYQLPRRKLKSTVLPPKLNVQDILDIEPNLRYRLDAPNSGVFRIFPGFTDSPFEKPDLGQPKINPLFEIRIPHT